MSFAICVNDHHLLLSQKTGEHWLVQYCGMLNQTLNCIPQRFYSSFRWVHCMYTFYHVFPHWVDVVRPGLGTKPLQNSWALGLKFLAEQTVLHSEIGLYIFDTTFYKRLQDSSPSDKGLLFAEWHLCNDMNSITNFNWVVWILIYEGKPVRKLDWFNII